MNGLIIKVNRTFLYLFIGFLAIRDVKVDFFLFERQSLVFHRLLVLENFLVQENVRQKLALDVSLVHNKPIVEQRLREVRKLRVIDLSRFGVEVMHDDQPVYHLKAVNVVGFELNGGLLGVDHVRLKLV